MSIFDAILSSAQQHPDLNQEQHSSLVQTAIQMFGNHSGLSGLMSNAQSQGIGHIVQSWVGTGANQGIASQQVEGLLGQERVQELASRAGIPPALASAALARVLPMIVDRLTPEGKIPQAA